MHSLAKPILAVARRQIRLYSGGAGGSSVIIADSRPGRAPSQIRTVHGHCRQSFLFYQTALVNCSTACRKRWLSRPARLRAGKTGRCARIGR